MSTQTTQTGDVDTSSQAAFGTSEVVYFVEGAGLVKIGRSTYVDGRVRDLRAASPVPLTVVMVIDGGTTLENVLHRHFASFRRHGEWFALPDGWQEEALRASDGVEELFPGSRVRFTHGHRVRTVRLGKPRPKRGSA